MNFKKKENTPVKSAGHKRRLRFRAGFTAVIVVAVAAVLLLNVIVGLVADRYPLTWDISKDKTFSLSEDSIKIAESIENEVDIVVFFDEGAFSNPSTGMDDLDTTLREFYNALRQFKTRSNGKVDFTFINPSQDPAGFSAYEKYDVKTGDMLLLCGDRYKVRTVFDDSYANDLYTIDTTYYSISGTVTVESHAEKMLTSSVYSISRGEDHIIQVLTGHSEDSQVIDGLKSLYELNGYSFEDHAITGSAAFNEKAETMLIAAPSKDYTSEELERIRKWVYNDNNYGRQLLVFINPLADCPNLYEFLEVEYQITVTDELMLETDLNRIMNNNRWAMLADVADTTWLETRASGTGTVFTQNVRRLTTTLPTSLENSIGSYAVTLTEYPKSVKLANLSTLESNATFDVDEHSHSLDEAEYPVTGMIMHVYEGYNNDTSLNTDGTVLVCGSPSMAYRENIQNNNLKNEMFLLDAVNRMTGVENVIGISSKAVESQKIELTSMAQLIVGLGVFTIGLPLIVLIVCLVVFLRRKNL